MSLRVRDSFKPLAAGHEIVPGHRVVALLTHGKRIDTYDVYSDERQCRCVAKVLREDRRHEDRVRKAVLLEGKLLCDLKHPHLVRGYEVFDDPPAMVIETLTGATLAAIIDDGPLSVADSALLGQQLASVLGYLHHHGWLHLDVKPANIIVEQGRATLIDLSLVGRPGDGRKGAGTRGYLSPEQARGEGLAAASDVWGLGVTLIEALTGEMPHGDEATWDSRPRVWPIHRRAPRPVTTLPGIPEDYDDLLRACLNLDPASRPTLDSVRGTLSRLVAED